MSYHVVITEWMVVGMHLFWCVFPWMCTSVYVPPWSYAYALMTIRVHKHIIRNVYVCMCASLHAYTYVSLHVLHIRTHVQTFEGWRRVCWIRSGKLAGYAQRLAGYAQVTGRIRSDGAGYAQMRLSVCGHQIKDFFLNLKGCLQRNTHLSVYGSAGYAQFGRVG